MEQDSINHTQNQNQNFQAGKILAQMRDKEMFVVNPRRKNGLILCKEYHAEFAGPGAAAGGLFDLDVVRILPVGNLTLICPQTSQERISAYLIRRQWIRLIKQITDNPTAIERAQLILNQFENWFDSKTVAQLPDEAFALLVGVLPQTIATARGTIECLESNL